MAINFKRLEEITRCLKSHNQTGKTFHTTFIYKGNKLLKIGHNSYKKLHREHKFGKYHPTKDDTSRYTAGVHSEMNAIIRLGQTDCSDLTFCNIRIGNNDKPLISKPCGNCRRVLEQVGFKTLWYYDGENYVKEKLKKT